MRTVSNKNYDFCMNVATDAWRHETLTFLNMRLHTEIVRSLDSGDVVVELEEAFV